MSIFALRMLPLIAVVPALACGRGTPPVSSPARIDEPAAKTVDAIARSPHGLYSLSSDDRIRLEQIRRDPAPYLSIIRERYAPGMVAVLARDVREANAFTTTAMVLGAIDSPEAADVLARWWVELDEALLGATDPSLATMLGRMQDTVLAALGAQPRTSVITRILDQLERMDRRRRVDSLHYLVRSSRGNAEVIGRLRAIQDAPASPLQGDGDVANAIARLSEAR